MKYYTFDNKLIHETDEVIYNFTGIVVHHQGTKSWYIDGKLHRLDGPAMEHSDGRKRWFINGKLHRLDGPAVEWRDGTKRWWIDGKHTGCEIDEEFNLLVDIMKLKGLL